MVSDVIATDAPLLICETVDGVAWLKMNRPEAYNALSMELMAEMLAALTNIANEDSVQVVVIRGAGQGFCAGHDMKQLRADPRETYYREVFATSSQLMKSILTLPQPVIAMVHGIATAAGAQLVATCDLAIAAQDARFATPGVNIGLFCSTPMVAVSRTIPRKHMMQMLLTGEMVNAKKALELGLINSVEPPDQLQAAVGELASKIVEKSPLVLKIGKEAFYRQLELPVDDAYAFAGEVMARNMLARDAEEGIDAFLEKRLPTWEGR